MVKSSDHASVKLSPEKMRHFQMLKKEYCEKCSFVTVDKKGDTCMNFEICSTVVK